MCLFRVGVYYILTSLKSIIQRKPKWLPFNQILERDLSRVFFTKTFAVIYEFIFFNFLIKDIQRDGKNSSIVSSVGTSKVRKSLQRVFDELNAPEFIFIDRGYIVNIVQIMKVSDSIAILKNGDQLPISRSHLQEVKRQINQFWGAHI